jgi:hypothetical protein
MDVPARREVAVVYDEEKDKDQMEAVSRLASEARAQRKRSKVMASLKRSLGMDDGTAAFYLDMAGGDVRRAYGAYLKDVEWDTRYGLGTGGNIAGRAFATGTV